MQDEIKKYWRAYYRDASGKQWRLSFRADNKQEAIDHANHCAKGTAAHTYVNLHFLGFNNDFNEDDFGTFREAK